MGTDSPWISITTRLPKAGQQVYARARYGTESRRVTFFDKPVARWEEPGYIYQLEYFAEWAPITDTAVEGKS
jgi:hypothetical protein